MLASCYAFWAIAPAVVSSQLAGYNNASERCSSACSQLSAAFEAHLHYPDQDNFRIWDAKQQKVRPACRVEPANSADVARILAVLVSSDCHFAVKGGGHSRSPGDSNAIQGVTLDLNRLSDVQVSANGTSAVVGGGATSAQTYAALEPRGLSFVGGRVGQVGVGGFTLGGGTYPFANKYGWALDNVLEYEVVLANSSIVTASESTNPDLFFALRGGANNFGIVTSFTMNTFPQGQIYVSQPVWGDNQSEAVLDEVYRLYTDPSLTSDVEMGYDMYFHYDAETDEFLMSGTQRYETPMASPPVFESIDRIPALMRSTRNATLANLTGAPPELGTTRNFFDTLSIQPSRKVLSQGLQIFREEVVAIKSVAELSPNFICYPLPTDAIARMKSRGGNALGIDQDEPLLLILLSASWSTASDDTAVMTMMKNVIERTRSSAERAGVAHPFLYLNYAVAGRAPEVFAGYGERNVERLKSVQAAVDPRGVFTANGLWRGFMKLW